MVIKLVIRLLIVIRDQISNSTLIVIQDRIAI